MSLLFDGKKWTARTSPELVWDQSENEVVLINLESGYYFSFNDCASEIWTRSLASERLYEASKLAPEAVGKFLEELGTHSLVTAQPAPEGLGRPEQLELAGAPELSSYSDLAEMLRLDPIHDVDSELGWPNTPHHD